ncbi:hypothetical protein ONZ45_g7817 [Pleurotus djamor]|nr:hypothetical protein ONZ45_g7817 [Pleurotus djamor]
MTTSAIAFPTLSSTSSPQPSVPQSPIPSSSITSSTTSSGSLTSVDDQVPPPLLTINNDPSPSSEAHPTSPPGTLTQRERKRTLSSLGPATSRFTLSYAYGLPWWGSTSNEQSASGGTGGIERSASASSSDTQASETPTIRASDITPKAQVDPVALHLPSSDATVSGQESASTTSTSRADASTHTTDSTAPSSTPATSLPISNSENEGVGEGTSVGGEGGTSDGDDASTSPPPGADVGVHGEYGQGHGHVQEGTWWDYLTWRSTATSTHPSSSQDPQAFPSDSTNVASTERYENSEGSNSAPEDIPRSTMGSGESVLAVDKHVDEDKGSVEGSASGKVDDASSTTAEATVPSEPPATEAATTITTKRGWFFSSSTPSKPSPPPSSSIPAATESASATDPSNPSSTFQESKIETANANAVDTRKPNHEAHTGAEERQGSSEDSASASIPAAENRDGRDAVPVAGTGAGAGAAVVGGGSLEEKEKQLDAMSMKSTDTQAAWYSPWAWVGYGGVADAGAKEAVAGDAGSEGAAILDKDNTDIPPLVVPTSTDVVASATDVTTPAVSTETTTTTVATVSDEPANPLESSITENASSWAYFFSTRGLLTKRIEGAGNTGTSGSKNAGGAGSGGGEMEVMDIDEEEGGSAGQVVVGAKEDAKTGKELVLSTKPREKEKKGAKTTLPSTPSTPTKSKAPTSSSTVPTSTTAPVGETEARGRGRDGKTLKDTDKDTASIKSFSTTSSAAAKVSAPPLTISDSVKRDVAASAASSPSTTRKNRKSISPAPSSKSTKSTKSTKPTASGATTPTKSSSKDKDKDDKGRKKVVVPNLVLPTWEDTFQTRPRNWVPRPPESTFTKTMKFVSGVLFAKDDPSSFGASESGGARQGSGGRAGAMRRRGSSSASMPNGGSGLSGKNLRLRTARDLKGKSKEIETDVLEFGKVLPRSWEVMEAASTSHGHSSGTQKASAAAAAMGLKPDVLRGCRKVVIIGIHGWFPGAVMRSVLGEPTGTSSKFVNMMVQALDDFQAQAGVTLNKVTKIPLEGEGTIDKRVERLYTNLLANEEWVGDIHEADAIFVATHSQGSIVSTHLLDRLLKDGHIVTSYSANLAATVGGLVDGVSPPSGPAQVTRKPQRPYIQYFESTAARELFDFQNTDSPVSKAYVHALHNVLDHRVKMVYVASLNDQVVPIYSGLFTSASHPLILRALYIDGDAYHSSDFLSNLLVLLLRIMNSGLSDSGLLTHLSEATAGSLNGIGHSTAYEEPAVFSLAVKYLFLTNDGLEDPPELTIEPFNVNNELNDYEIPWALRDLIADDRVYHLFEKEITQLRDAFRDWQPRTTVLRDIKRKLQPIQRLPSSSTTTTNPESISKL